MVVSVCGKLAFRNLPVLVSQCQVCGRLVMCALLCALCGMNCVPCVVSCATCNAHATRDGTLQNLMCCCSTVLHNDQRRFWLLAVGCLNKLTLPVWRPMHLIVHVLVGWN